MEKGTMQAEEEKGRGGIEKIAKKSRYRDTGAPPTKFPMGGGGRIHGHPNPPTPKI